MSNVEPVTEAERLSWPKRPLVTLEPPFTDLRGSIQPLVDRPMRSAMIIESKAGTVRANHYHRTDWHYCYVLSGAMDYFYRTTGSSRAPECIRIEQGQTVFTPPLEDHAMCFPVDTVFLVLARNPRDQATYEADTVRIDLIDTSGYATWRPGQ